MAGSVWLLATTLLVSGEPPRERICYATRRPANWHSLLVEKGSSPRRITSGLALDYDATFSPDGRWVVFCSERSGNPHLYAMDTAHPGAPRQLTHGQFMDAAPAFTPDGGTLLFVSDRAGNADVFAVPFRPDDPGAGVEARNLTHDPAGDFRPAVSPDGKTVAFSSDRDYDEPYPYRAEIYTSNLNGSEPRRLTSTDAMNGSPAWSHDGRALYFYSDREGGGFRIWAMDSDGRHQRALTPRTLAAFSPAVMPDGRVAFAVKKPDGFRIMSVKADGSDVRLESEAQHELPGPGVRSSHRTDGLHGPGIGTERAGGLLRRSRRGAAAGPHSRSSASALPLLLDQPRRARVRLE